MIFAALAFVAATLVEMNVVVRTFPFSSKNKEALQTYRMICKQKT